MDNLEVKINKHGGARAGAGRKRKEGCEGENAKLCVHMMSGTL